MRHSRLLVLTAFAQFAALLPLQAAPAPQPLPLPPAIAAAQDAVYPGTLRLDVDATDVTRGIFRMKETIPVTKSGPMTLLYPKWLPGHHSPVGPVDKLAGLIIKANGKRIDWTRDKIDVFAFHIDVPDGTTRLDLEFEFLSPVAPHQGRRVMTPNMLNLQWNAVTLYPAGYFARGIPVSTSVKLPDGWTLATALETTSTEGAVTRFKTVPFDRLVDSPIFAGRYFKTFDLDPGSAVPVRLNVVADGPEYLEATPEQIAIHRKMVQQADKLFKSRHYDHYDFLLALSDDLGGIGLEHHRSSENGVKPGYFTEWDKGGPGRSLLSHEYTHSWNGKFRRAADLWTPTFNEPMRDSLLWVYEGQTQYWGFVLAARSGLLSKQQALDGLAQVAAKYANQAGRTWRALIDTTNDPIIAERNSMPWSNWQRREDYYSEGQLIWLDADTLIRDLSKGKRSLDDFASAFFGIDDGSYDVATYDFNDVVAALNKIQPYDWAAFLKKRVDEINPQAPLDGLARGGYELVYTDVPSEFAQRADNLYKSTSLLYSLGISINKANMLSAVMWDSPAFNAGLTVSTKLIAVNGSSYEPEKLKAAIKAAKDGKEPIDLLVQNGDHFRSVKIDYHDGLRYPHLKRIDGKAARLDDILKPRK